MNFSRAITVWSEQRPEQTAIRFEGGSITYRELEGRIVAATAELSALGIRPGQRVAYLGLNHPVMLVLLFALCRLGAIFQPLNFRLSATEHARQLLDSTPSLFFHADEYRAHLEDVAAQAPLPAVTDAEALWESTGHATATGQPTATGIPPPAGDPQSPTPQPGSLNDDALLVYTSGTSGEPKGVLLTQEALLFNCINSIHAHDLTPADHGLIVLPLFHVGGLNIMLLPLLYVGASVTLHRRFDPALLLRDITLLRPTLLLMVPATISAAIAEPGWEQADLSSLRMINTGSSVVPLSLIEAWHARGIPVGQVYGSTETCPIAIYLRAEDATRKAGSAGRAAMHCEVDLVDGAGTAVAAGVTGEIRVRGPSVMRGYFGRPEATAAAIQDGWYRTGDLARQDEDGFFWVVGRSKDMIVSGGENIYPAELEAVLADSPAIAEAAVVGVPDERWGEVPVAVVIRRSPDSIDETGVAALFEGRLARYKRPKRIVFVDDLPRTALGKVQKSVLAARLGESAGAADTGPVKTST
ncbi:MAG TPA: AMP-binding protein [Lautropia sp.]|nr:AMP-binding protein [Lautropia sp.]